MPHARQHRSARAAAWSKKTIFEKIRRDQQSSAAYLLSSSRCKPVPGGLALTLCLETGRILLETRPRLRAKPGSARRLSWVKSNEKLTPGDCRQQYVQSSLPPLMTTFAALLPAALLGAFQLWPSLSHDIPPDSRGSGLFSRRAPRPFDHGWYVRSSRPLVTLPNRTLHSLFSSDTTLLWSWLHNSYTISYRYIPV